jgi:hypothetical protein
MKIYLPENKNILSDLMMAPILNNPLCHEAAPQN